MKEIDRLRALRSELLGRQAAEDTVIITNKEAMTKALKAWEKTTLMLNTVEAGIAALELLKNNGDTK